MLNAVDLIKKHFQSILHEYGFLVSYELYSPELMGNAVVVFISTMTGIKVVIDRSQVLINIGELSMPEDEWFELSDVIRYFSPFIEQVYVFPKDIINYQSAVEFQLDWLVNLINKYCSALLNGDFSMRDQIKDIERKRVEEMRKQFKRLSEKKQ